MRSRGREVPNPKIEEYLIWGRTGYGVKDAVPKSSQKAVR